MSASVIQDQTFDQGSVALRAVLHLHDLNHVQIAGGLVDGQHGVHADSGQLVGQLQRERKIVTATFNKNSG